MEIETVLSWVGAALLILTPLAHGLRGFSDFLVDRALRTSDPDDDARALRFQTWTVRIADAIDWVAGMLPTVRRGPGESRK